MEKELTRKYHCSAAQCDAQKELSLRSLADNLIEIATAHADMLGIGNNVMPGSGWVLARLTIEMEKLPPVLSEYYVTTWVQGWNRHFSERCFEIQNEAGDTLGYARSVWMVMDLISHENKGLTHLNLPIDIVSDRNCPIARQSKHSPLENSSETEYKFVYSDIDFYRHVNTLRYIQILLNQFSINYYDANRIARFEIAFMHECYYGEIGKIALCMEGYEANLSISTSRAQALRSKIIFAPR